MLDIRGLRKAYGDLAAVHDISFSLKAGEVVGLLGPNGAGKTTTVSMIAGLVVPESGQVLIGGAARTGDTDPHKRLSRPAPCSRSWWWTWWRRASSRARLTPSRLFF